MNMLSFKIYTYQFSPLGTSLDDSNYLFQNLDRPTDDKVMAEKQQTLSDLFKEDSGFRFSKGDQLFRHQVILNYNGMIALKIANNKTILREDNFTLHKLTHQPSSLVIIDNRHDCQTIAIQRLVSSFAKPDTLARIMASSFNDALRQYGLRVEIRARIEEHTFWRLVESLPEGVKSIKFDLAYPNLPRVSDNVASVFKSINQELGAESRYEVNALYGKTLNLDKGNEVLQGLVKASSESGRPIKILGAGAGQRWISTGNDSEVIQSIPENAIEKKDGTLIDDRFEKITEALNKYKS